MHFRELKLRDELTRTLEGQGYKRATPIQAKAIPVALEGNDLLAGAQTGTGKTAAFALPILHRLSQEKNKSLRRPPRALILTPTRELAAQVGESFKTYGSKLKLRTVIIFGGVGFNPQADRLRNGCDILVATPGRLLDHSAQGTLKLNHVEILVLDEGDRMLDMGFIHDIKRIIKLLPKERQNMLFSATYSDEIKRLADSFLNNPKLIEVARSNAAAEKVAQKVYPVAKTQKRKLLSKLIREGNWSRVLVFTRTKHGANRLAKQLEIDGISATAIHGNKSQNARTKALADFKANKVCALVATDVASRGLDISELPHVVNYELPNVAEDYVHRIGRTGRAGAKGIAVSLVSADERNSLADIQKLLGKKIDVEVIEGFQQEEHTPSAPLRKPGNRAPSDYKPKREEKRPSAGKRGTRRPKRRS